MKRRVLFCFFFLFLLVQFSLFLLLQHCVRVRYKNHQNIMLWLKIPDLVSTNMAAGVPRSCLKHPVLSPQIRLGIVSRSPWKYPAVSHLQMLKRRLKQKSPAWRPRRLNLHLHHLHFSSHILWSCQENIWPLTHTNFNVCGLEKHTNIQRDSNPEKQPNQSLSYEDVFATINAINNRFYIYTALAEEPGW